LHRRNSRTQFGSANGAPIHLGNNSPPPRGLLFREVHNDRKDLLHLQPAPSEVHYQLDLGPSHSAALQQLSDRSKNKTGSLNTDTFVPEDGASRQTPAMSVGENRDGVPEGNSRNDGLLRTIFAGPGRTLADAFANLEQSPQVERLCRHPQRDLVAARVSLTPEEGEGYWELTRIRNDFYVILWNFLYKNPRFEIIPGDGLVQFNFKISGDLTLAVSRTEPLRFNRPSLLVWAQSAGIDINEWTAPRAHERMISISVRPEFLVDHFMTSTVDMPPQLQAFISNPCGRFGYCLLPLTAEMFGVANKLINNPLSGKLALVYTEALTLELLCTAVSGFCALPAKQSEEYTDRTLKCLQKARGLLMRQLAPAPKIRQLARAAGMAETALTRGFKAVYGQTVFEFSLCCRMQHALMLLRDRHWSVDKVSEAVGYSHSTSFATAFRRHFGMRPIEVRHIKAK
jgi:AraC-like DNA-binding protein